MKKKIALIFGITGQDGSLLSRLLIKKGYIVHGIKRRSSSYNTGRIDDLYNTYSSKKIFFLHYGDLTDSLNVFNHIKEKSLNRLAPFYNIFKKIFFENNYHINFVFLKK